MGVAVLNGLTLVEFVEDTNVFVKCINDYFALLDVNGDGLLSRAELSQFYNMVFDRITVDEIDRAEFAVEMKEIILAVARGIGDSPVQVALDNESLLMKAVEHERAKTLPLSY